MEVCTKIGLNIEKLLQKIGIYLYEKALEEKDFNRKVELMKEDFVLKREDKKKKKKKNNIFNVINKLQNNKGKKDNIEKSNNIKNGQTKSNKLRNIKLFQLNKYLNL